MWCRACQSILGGLWAPHLSQGLSGKPVFANQWCLAPCQMSQPACSFARYSKRWLIVIVLLQCTLFTCRQDTVTLICRCAPGSAGTQSDLDLRIARCECNAPIVTKQGAALERHQRARATVATTVTCQGYSARVDLVSGSRRHTRATISSHSHCVNVPRYLEQLPEAINKYPRAQMATFSPFEAVDAGYSIKREFSGATVLITGCVSQVASGPSSTGVESSSTSSRHRLSDSLGIAIDQSHKSYT